MNFGNLPISAETLRDVTANGSPALLRGVGGLLGIGEAEQAALKGGRLPWWLFTTVGMLAGIYVGAQAYKRWPDRFPEFMR